MPTPTIDITTLGLMAIVLLINAIAALANHDPNRFPFQLRFAAVNLIVLSYAILYISSLIGHSQSVLLVEVWRFGLGVALVTAVATMLFREATLRREELKNPGILAIGNRFARVSLWMLLGGAWGYLNTLLLAGGANPPLPFSCRPVFVSGCPPAMINVIIYLAAIIFGVRYEIRTILARFGQENR